MTNPENTHYADELLANQDVAAIITELYSIHTFDSDEATTEVLGKYFSLISIKEAKQIVLAAYAKEA